VTFHHLVFIHFLCDNDINFYKKCVEYSFTFSEKHTAVDKLTEILGWMFYGISHMSNKVIKVGIEARYLYIFLYIKKQFYNS
jgi:hypothetical protein